MSDPAFDPTEEKKLVEWLHTHIGLENFKPGLSRLEKMVGPYREDLKKRGVFLVTVGGTNGKGETCHALSYLLLQRGISYGLWTSPHVVSVRERILLQGKPVSYDVLWKSLLHCYERLPELGATSPTYYEFMFMVFLDILLTFPFPRPLEVCLLEVGLGGRLDGVNILDPHLTAITSISRDHEQILGKGLRRILLEKLGITRPGVPLITALELAYCRQQVEAYTEPGNIPWGDLFAWGGCDSRDHYSLRNRKLALVLFWMLQGLREGKKGEDLVPMVHDPAFRQKLERDLQKKTFPQTRGRSDTMTLGKRRFIFIGAHNIDGMRKLKTWIREQEENREKPLFDLALMSFSRRPLEEIRNLVRIMLGTPAGAREVVVTHFDHERSADLSTLSQLAEFPEGRHFRLDQEWKTLITSEKETQENILVTGSYYFIGAVESFLHEKNPSL